MGWEMISKRIRKYPLTATLMAFFFSVAQDFFDQAWKENWGHAFFKVVYTNRFKMLSHLSKLNKRLHSHAFSPTKLWISESSVKRKTEWSLAQNRSLREGRFWSALECQGVPFLSWRASFSNTFAKKRRKKHESFATQMSLCHPTALNMSLQMIRVESCKQTEWASKLKQATSLRLLFTIINLHFCKMMKSYEILWSRICVATRSWFYRNQNPMSCNHNLLLVHPIHDAHFLFHLHQTELLQVLQRLWTEKFWGLFGYLSA